MEDDKRKLRVRFIGVGERPRVVEIEPELESLQRAVGGDIEALQLSGQTHGYIRGEGKFVSLPHNRFATQLCTHLDVGLQPRDWIAGPMLCVSLTAEGEDDDVSESFVETVLNLWDQDNAGEKRYAADQASSAGTADVVSLLSELRSDVEESSTMEPEDRAYVADRLDDVLGMLHYDLSRLLGVAKARLSEDDGEVARLAAFVIASLEPFGAATDAVVASDGRLRCSACGNDEFGYVESCQDYRTPGGQDPKAKTVAVVWSADGTADSDDSNPGLICDNYRGQGCGKPVRLPDSWEIDYQ